MPQNRNASGRVRAMAPTSTSAFLTVSLSPASPSVRPESFQAALD
jgi:hypothetical protein